MITLHFGLPDCVLVTHTIVMTKGLIVTTTFCALCNRKQKVLAPIQGDVDTHPSVLVPWGSFYLNNFNFLSLETEELLMSGITPSYRQEIKSE